MTNATHTPGPWVPTTRTGERLTPATYVVEDADRLPVVMAWRAADARLIATAPELLEALENAVFALESAIILRGMGELSPYADAAHKAINKAKGN